MELPVSNPIEMGKGITDFGFVVMTAAAYLIYSSTITFLFVRWFIRIVDGIIDRQHALDKILQILEEMSSTKTENHPSPQGRGNGGPLN